MKLNQFLTLWIRIHQRPRISRNNRLPLWNPLPKKAKIGLSANKVMATVFLGYGRYTSITLKGPQNDHKSVDLIKNDRIYWTKNSLSLGERKLVPHPPYCPDFAPVTFTYSRILKNATAPRDLVDWGYLLQTTILKSWRTIIIRNSLHPGHRWQGK